MKSVSILARDLAALKREARDAVALARTNANLLLESRAQAVKDRGRAERAEFEVSEWKRRFDALLARTPEVK